MKSHIYTVKVSGVVEYTFLGHVGPVANILPRATATSSMEIKNPKAFRLKR